jgi:hypothetical protein
MRRLMLILLAVASLAGARAFGATCLERSYGSSEIGLSARSRAMGGAGAALSGGVYSLVDNPAAMALERGSRLQLGGGLSRVSENRYVPLFDTFDSYVDEAAIAVNDHQYGAANGGIVLDRGLMLGAGVFERYDPRYDYADERRSTSSSDQLVAERFIRTRGVLRSATVGIAAPFSRLGAGGFFPRGSLGLAFNWYYGTLTDRDALVPHVSTASGYVTSLERRLSGPSLTAGTTVDVSERLRGALSIETGPLLRNRSEQVRNDSVITTAPFSRGLHLPPRVQGAIAYRPRNTFLTTFAMDVIYVPWSRIDDQFNPGQQLLDTWDVRFGLEHVYYNTLPGRIGFRYQRSYAMREADRVTFTFGVGYRLERFGLDLATEVGKRDSRQDPFWPRTDQGPAVGAGRDRVEDTVVRLYLGTQVQF